jgi:hypothetical protein
MDKFDKRRYARKYFAIPGLTFLVFFTLLHRKPRVAYSAVVAYGYEGWINPWMSASRVSSVALAKDDTLRRVAPDEACGGCHGRKPVGLHFLYSRALPKVSLSCGTSEYWAYLLL